MAKEKLSEETKEEIKKQTHKEIAKDKIKKFNREFSKSVSTAIVAAFGFLMALVWRDVITEWVNKISESSPVQGKLISALIVTLISVFGIMAITKIFKEKESK
jgi:hypothetical protein